MLNKQIFGENLRQFRIETGLCRQEFAEKCGLSLYTIRSYQSGAISPSMTSLLKICEAFAVSPNRLLADQYQHPTEQGDIVSIERNLSALSTEGKALFKRIYSLLFSETVLINADYGTRLHLLRKQIKMHKKEFSKLCHISENTLSAKESSQSLPDIDNLLTFCAILAISPEYFLCGNLTFYSPSSHPYLYLFPTQIAAFSSLSKYMTHISIQ